MKNSTSNPFAARSRSGSLLALLSVITSGGLAVGCAGEDPADTSATPISSGPMPSSSVGAPTAPGAGPTSPDPSGTGAIPSGPGSTLVPSPSNPVGPTGTAPVGTEPVLPAPSASSTGPTTEPPAPTTVPTNAPAPSASVPGPITPPEQTNPDHCLYGYDPLPSDETMAHGPALYTGGGQVDTILQPEVLQWMEENQWMGAHVIWHAVRGCNSGTAGGLLAPLGLPNLCQDYPFLVPTDQNCRTAGDGYQFLLFHRHMIETLKQLWPKHAADFDGFPKFPTSAEELPEVWNESDPTWSAEALEAAEIADNIEQHLDLFPDEGSVGYWLQCPPGSRAPDFAPDLPYIGLHFNLHDEWTRGANADHGLNNGQVNITNYMFWKLHGWIDKVWEKYRVAKGLTTDPAAMQKYKADMVAQCREMDIESQILIEMSPEPIPIDCPPEVDETGDFHTKVRPILENDANHCAGCHGPAQTSPYAGLTLGGSISSKCVVERLKRESISGGQFKLVEPGEPEKSWLYLKAAGLAESAGCEDGANPCNTAVMPPGGQSMTEEELKVLYDWIAAGAN